MNGPSVDTLYTLQSIQKMLAVSRRVLSGLIGAGFVAPTRGPRNEYRFTFQDVVLLRTAYGLQAARIPPRRILRSLQRLKATLPHELPLSGLRITAVGNDIAVREGSTHWAAESGQLLLDFEVAPARGSVAFLQPQMPTQSQTQRQSQTRDEAVDDDPAEWFARGDALEADDPQAAEAAYRRSLSLAPDYADAYLNLGAMLCAAHRFDEAVALYDAALAHCPHEALLHYNRAVALEDQQRLEEALAAYEASIRLAPTFADARYNAALLHERLGNPHLAIRRLNEYRRLSR